MASNSIMRALAGTAVAAIGTGIAVATGATPTAALVALLSGVVAVAIAWSAAPAPQARIARPERIGPPALPGAAEILAAIDEPLLIVRNRRVAIANPAARAVLGDHIEGVDVRLAIRHPAAAQRLASDGAADGEAPVTRTELVGLGERERRWEMTTGLLRDGGRLVRLSDRSGLHASEQMRVDFVANASHELRTPLATLLGFLETLDEDPVAAADLKTRSRFVKIMFGEAKRMHRLVDDLISLSRIEAERFVLPREPIDLMPLIDEVRSGCGTLIEEKQSAILVENKAASTVVPGDRLQMLQLLQNLIVNALKYGRAGTPVIIRFDDVEPDMLRMSVVDQGEGIAADHLPRLTERFYRVDPGRSRGIGGTGLGLAIVKHIVGRHRGRLDIRSEVGTGTNVRVYLPRRTAMS